MRVAIVHYHLEPGGVTSVILNASRALERAGIPHAVLTQAQIPGLGYLSDPGDLTAHDLLLQLRQAATAALGGAPDLWHFHNHSLGKNRLFPELIQRLALAGERLLLQIHDLAENGRPANHPLIAGISHLYPFAPRIGYAFINSRDLECFVANGLPRENAWFLPNPIQVRPPVAAAPEKPLLFAPIRGIRRKNLGELVLLSALVPAGTRVAVSRAPLNPQALAIHDSWQAFAIRHALPIDFAVVGRIAPGATATPDFDSWVSHANHFISTSVSEGFGLPFLEAVAAGKPLIARNLPHLTKDHAAHGIRTGSLYDRFLIPLEWIGERILRGHVVTTLRAHHHAYGQSLALETPEAVLQRLVCGNHVDFGNLPESLQQTIIARMADPGQRAIPQIEVDGHPVPAVDWLAAAISRRTPSARPDELTPYLPEAYQSSVVAMYAHLLAQPYSPPTSVAPEKILSSHLTPESFHFLLSPAAPAPVNIRAVIFDIYGTLLIAPGGGVKEDPAADANLRQIIRRFGHQAPDSPSAVLAAAVRRHHAMAGVRWPEVDLRVLWQEVLGLPRGTDTTGLLEATEAAWHPATPMPGAEPVVRRLAMSGLALGLLSNAQSNTLPSLGPLAASFQNDLTLLSYQHGIAKPSPELFAELTERLAVRGIEPAETLYIGNDPLHDIVPACAAGWLTALFTGHPDSLRAGDCSPDFILNWWNDLLRLF